MNQDVSMASVAAIGFRVEPSKFHWAVVTNTHASPNLVAAGTYDFVVGESEAETLSSCRRETSDLCERHSPTRAWIRYAERSPGRQGLMERCRGEGVIMATLDARGIRVFTGKLVSMGAALKHGKTSLKPYLDADRFRTIDWSTRALNVREAILAAVCALSG